MASVLVVAAALFSAVTAGNTSLDGGFADPPVSARPHVWWHWMNGNVTKEGVTADLEAMAEAGIGGAQIFDAGCAVPAGQLKFNSPEWVDMICHAATVARRLGLEICLSNCSGWSSSGGPWIAPSNAMKRVVFSEARVKGPSRAKIRIGREANDHGFYSDIALLAFPTPQANLEDFRDVRVKVERNAFQMETATTRRLSGISVRLDFPWAWNADAKLLIEVSRDGTNYLHLKDVDLVLSRAGDGDRSLRFVSFGSIVEAQALRGTVVCGSLDVKVKEVRPEAKLSLSGLKAKTFDVRQEFQEDVAVANVDQVVAKSSVREIGAALRYDGTVEWDVPKGEWTLLRVGCVCNGRKNRPASEHGVGLEVDKLSASAVASHFEEYVGRVCRASGVCGGRQTAGLNNVLIDSYEVGSQNWTQGLEREFMRRCGYDCMPYFPVFAGYIVNGVEESERFLEDFRRVVADLFAENYSGKMLRKCREYGLMYSLEPYGSCPADDLQYGMYADVPMCEFWSNVAKPYSPGDGNARFASWIAHVWGKPFCGAEAFTAAPGAKSGRWMTTPFGIKAQSDLAFSDGVNRLIYHRFAHQPWPTDKYVPGMTMGRWGMHLDRTQTWWPFAKPFFRYQSRCQYLLQRGKFVADVLFFAGEAVPGDGGARDVSGAKFANYSVPYGYAYDVCPASAMDKLKVEDGDVVSPGGVRYRMLVVPPMRAMSLKTAQNILRLSQHGARIVWREKPSRAIGLSGGKTGDDKVRRTADRVFSYGVIDMTVADALNKLSVAPQIAVDKGVLPKEVKNLSWIHRAEGTTQWFFVAMPNREETCVEVSFRVKGMEPEIWDPETGACETAECWRIDCDRTVVAVPFGVCGSKFVMFRKPTMSSGSGVRSVAKEDEVELAKVAGPWEVSFPNGFSPNATAKGADEIVAFDKLISWTDRPEAGVKYFSGIATYRCKIGGRGTGKGEGGRWIRLRQGFVGQAGGRVFLDLGEVRELAEVMVNGKKFDPLWHPPFRVDITDVVATMPSSSPLDLQIRVANLWANRLIGDDQTCPPDCEWVGEVRRGVKELGIKEIPQWVKAGLQSPTGRHTFTTWKHWDKNDGLLPSGLLGPVRIVVRKKGH